MEEFKLTQYAKGAGCGCKIAPSVLENILANSRVDGVLQENLLVGNSSNDDAAVYDLKNGMALLVTADFFMPIVDDAYTFGKIAAANAISDVYAMGGKPITAIALLGWPIDKLPAELAAKVMAGAKEICKEAGIVISGGHTIDSVEPFFGLSVNGMVAIENIKRNSTAKVGDVLMLTKPLGVGILATAQKRGVLKKEHEEVLVNALCSLNSVGEFFGTQKNISAMTDVTGFGIMGHAIEMAEGAGLSIHLEFAKLPVLTETQAYMDQHILPDATFRNWNAYLPKTTIAEGIDPKQSFSVLPDPQTNGGLLLAVRAGTQEELKKAAAEHGVEIWEIGRFEQQGEKVLSVV
jgi:selenide,water dikinase